MREFIIKRTDGADFPSEFDLQPEEYEKCLKLPGFKDSTDPMQNYTFESTNISLSFEPPGIQVVFEGEISDEKAESLVDTMTQCLSKKSGKPADYLQIT